MKCFYIDNGLRSFATARLEFIGRAAFKLRLPLRDLIRMNVELFCELRNCFVAFDRQVLLWL